jgi:hypothetical protein
MTPAIEYEPVFKLSGVQDYGISCFHGFGSGLSHNRLVSENSSPDSEFPGFRVLGFQVFPLSWFRDYGVSSIAQEAHVPGPC